MPPTAKDPAEVSTLTVSQLNRRARSLLESHFDFVWVSGELSNLARPSSGHWYFTLKDDRAQVRCAMFRNRNQRLRFSPEQGDEIRIRCRVSLYEGRGDFQLIVEHMELAGAGALQAAFEKLKAKLQSEGLFDAARKQPIPDNIEHIGVVTSPSGAAIHDILTVLERRWPSMRITLLPVSVQGDTAAAQIARAIELANRVAASGDLALDALIVGRGGGSLEDLWAFNEERVARAIAASDLPVISAVGHEIDFSIADFAADQRAATPSQAAEMISPDRREWLEWLDAVENSLAQLMASRLLRLNTAAQHLRQRLRHPGALLREQSQRADDLEQRMARAQRHRLSAENAMLRLLRTRLRARSPVSELALRRSETTRLELRMAAAIARQQQHQRERVNHVEKVLESLSPVAILSRGYSILARADGKAVRRPQDVTSGEFLSARLAQGHLTVQVRDEHKED